MGELPFGRNKVGLPNFYKTGINFFGQILTKQVKKTQSATLSKRRDAPLV